MVDSLPRLRGLWCPPPPHPSRRNPGRSASEGRRRRLNKIHVLFRHAGQRSEVVARQHGPLLRRDQHLYGVVFLLSPRRMRPWVTQPSGQPSSVLSRPDEDRDRPDLPRTSFLPFFLSSLARDGLPSMNPKPQQVARASRDGASAPGSGAKKSVTDPALPTPHPPRDSAVSTPTPRSGEGGGESPPFTAHPQWVRTDGLRGGRRRSFEVFSGQRWARDVG